MGVAPIELEGDVARDLSEPAATRLQAAIAEDFEVVAVATDGECDDACLAAAAREADVPAVVQVRIAVENRDYTLRTRVVDASTGEVLREDENSCEICTYDESLEVLDQQLGNVGAALHKLLDEEPEPEPVVTTTNDAPGPRRNGKALRIAGWSMIGAGAAAAISGVALMAIDENPHEGSCNGDSVDVNGTCEFRYDTLAGGVGLLVGGLAVAGGGVALVIVDKRGRERATATAAATPRGFVITGRF